MITLEVLSLMLCQGILFSLPYRSFEYIYWLSVLCFHGIPVFANICVSVSICICGTFPLALFLLFVLSYSDLFVFGLSYFTFFSYYSLDACLFSKERQKGYKDKSREELRGVWGEGKM